ncbi:MAG TPA: hypothetical protein VGB78_05440 [Thermoplasmata archaeon]|jgi:xanthine/uracil permease
MKLDLSTKIIIWGWIFLGGGLFLGLVLHSEAPALIMMAGAAILMFTSIAMSAQKIWRRCKTKKGAS